MALWKFIPLVFGTIEVTKELVTTGLDRGLKLVSPYLGVYLTDGKNKVLVDTGINDRYIVDGKAWGGLSATGGEAYVLTALKTIGVTPEEIQRVIYTHLHNDHAGNSHLFPNAIHIFQDAEWKELIDPLPSAMIRGDYDQAIISVFKDINCQRVTGDVDILDGIRLILTPGHTKGSQCLVVTTKAGVYVIAGDTIHALPIAFPQMDKWVQMDGTVISITPAPKHWGPAVPSGILYDHYAWYQSIYRIHALLRSADFLIPGHEPSVVGKTFG